MKKQSLLACFLLPLLSACSSQNIPTPIVGSNINPIDYLQHYIDGKPLKSSDLLTSYRTDIGNFQAAIAAVQPDGSVIYNWQYQPFDKYDPSKGDGGEQYDVANGVARIRATRDGSVAYDQYFTGATCGGTGWILFKSDADSTWKNVEATLSDEPTPTNCQHGSYSYTEYSRQSVNFPVVGKVDTIISRHYYNILPELSDEAEEFFFGYHISRIGWLLFKRTPAKIDLSSRCPDFGYDNLGPGWYLNDCRINVNLNTNTSNITESDLWHPAN